MVQKPFKDRVMLIGDAAGMAKPTTGGGIGPGFRQVKAIISDLIYAVESDHLLKADLAIICNPYKAMRKEQARARALRDLLVTLPADDELDDIFALFNRPEVLELINLKGDIEHPVPLGMTLLKRVPEFRKLALKAGIKILFA
jgi:flavin-dependent dehydrogenase